MPRYTYTCPNCGATKTLLRPVAERNCPVECSEGYCETSQTTALYARTTRRLMTRNIGGPAFHLKGKAWAKDGYGG